MKFIKKLNEGLGDFDFAQAQEELNNTEGDQKLTVDTFNNQIDMWDPEKLTSNFKTTLMLRVGEHGWDEKDPFLKWLQNTDDNNIKNLDEDSAKHLINLLDDKKLEFDNDYLLKDNNLFVEDSKNIIYKLNILYILLNPKEADKYKNSNGETPNIDLIYENNKFKNSKDIKILLDEFVTDDPDDNENTIDFITWAHTKGKIPKGKEFTQLRYRLSLKKGKWEDYYLDAFEDLRKMINTNDKNKLQALGKVQVDKNSSWDDIIEKIIDALKNKDYDVQTNVHLLAALAANAKNFSIESLEDTPKNAIDPILTLFKNDNSFNIDEKVLSELILDDSKFKILKNTLIPNMKINTIKEAIKKFILKYSNESTNKEKF